jgi:hypothetical protein
MEPSSRGTGLRVAIHMDPFLVVALVVLAVVLFRLL